MTKRFIVGQTAIPGVRVIERVRLKDPRGYFERLFCISELAGAGWMRPVVQINRTFTARKGAVRGLHFQRPPHSEMKLVTCTHGAIFDVAVDLRRESDSFMQWHGEVLSSDNCRSLMIPEACAHGYQCLTDDVELLYLHTEKYAADAEGGIHPEDPRLAITWPLSVTDLSAKDASRTALADDFAGISP
jgi:dTDP-4-dehydrorhamnose 3,5-epimerase